MESIKKTDLSVLYVHVKPPSLEVLEQRLRARKTDSEDAMQKRLGVAKKELEYGRYTYLMYISVSMDAMCKGVMCAVGGCCLPTSIPKERGGGW